MWTLVLGAAALATGWALYKAVTGGPAPPLLSSVASRVASPLAPAPGINAASSKALSKPLAKHPGALDTPKLKQRASYCGLQVNDWYDATQWAAKNVHPGLELLPALALYYNMNPSAAWNVFPEPVRRVYCTYLGA